MRPLKLSRNNVALRVDKFLLECNHVTQLQILRAKESPACDNSLTGSALDTEKSLYRE